MWWWVYQAKTNTALVQLLDGGLPELVNCPRKTFFKETFPNIQVEMKGREDVKCVVSAVLYSDLKISGLSGLV